MYDPDLHTWGEDTLDIVRDAEIDGECDNHEHVDPAECVMGDCAPRRDDTR